MGMFEYEIKDELGIHARPAGLLVKEASRFKSAVTVKKGEKSADAKSIFALMGLGAKKGDTICVIAEGEDELDAMDELEKFVKTIL